MESLAGALAKVDWLALTKTLAAAISLLMQDGHKRVVTFKRMPGIEFNSNRGEFPPRWHAQAAEEKCHG